jgi:UDP-glucuronate decarboxylase
VKLKTNVTCLDNFSTGLRSNIDHLIGIDNFRVLSSDVSEFKKDETFDYILHLASRPSPEDYQLHPIETLLTSSTGSYTVLELARKNDSRIILASTSEVYGDAKVIPTPEDYWGNVNPVGMRSCYDEGKRFAEALCMAYFREHQVDVRIARIFNTYGPRIRPDGAYARVVPRFILQALGKQDITVYGDGSQTRSFTYVTDTLKGILSVFCAETLGGEEFNIGTSEETTVLELAEIVKKSVGSPSKIVFLPLPMDDPKRRNPDIGKAERKLKWHPEMGLGEGLNRTISWFKQHTNACPK